MTRTPITFFIAAALELAAGAANAQTAAATATARDTEQQQRIENGLQSGQLSTREAGWLERDEQRVERTEARAMRDGTVTDAERARIAAEQNATSRAIYRQKHDAQTGNPLSTSSQRMQADVQRNVNQQARIEQGVASGELTNHEAARLERGQAHVDRREANAAADGHVGPREQARTQAAENRQSARIYGKKHNARER